MTPVKYCPPCVIALHHFVDYTGQAISQGKQLNDNRMTNQGKRYATGIPLGKVKQPNYHLITTE